MESPSAPDPMNQASITGGVNAANGRPVGDTIPEVQKYVAFLRDNLSKQTVRVWILLATFAVPLVVVFVEVLVERNVFNWRYDKQRTECVFLLLKKRILKKQILKKVWKEKSTLG